MESDTSDILGHPTMLAARPARRGITSLSLTQYICAVIALYALFVIGTKVRVRVLYWREQSVKLATRRRYGIPDKDRRPFNVAYSEAMRVREEARKNRPEPSRPQPPVVDLREASQEQTIRNRTGYVERQDVRMRSTVGPIPGAYRAESAYPYTPSYLQDHQDIEDNNLPDTTPYQESHTSGHFTHAPAQPKKGLRRRRAHLNVIEEAESIDKKRSFEDDEEMLDEEHEVKAKKTRLQSEADDQLMDEDELPRQRGSKRAARYDEDEDGEAGLDASKSGRGKRARQVSRAGSLMEVDEEADEVRDLRQATVRGKKRDRAEAGSTFGGDDDEEAGSAGEFETDKARRRRKRRTVAKRKSEASHARGKKRDREGLDEDSDKEPSGESSNERSISSRNKKRGKRGSLLPGQAQALRRGKGDDDAGSDVSMGESVATSIRNSGRNVGDEWESNGVKYKVGPNFQRLRLALVKKSTQKYPMPADSVHPDRNANIQVCVETWLTEEQYREAKAKRQLAWQDDSPTPAPAEKLKLDITAAQQEPVPFPKAHVGKVLLWDSTTTTPAVSPAPLSPLGEQTLNGPATPANGGRQGKHYRHSIATPDDLSINPFMAPQNPSPSKRISSGSRPYNLASSISGSPLSTTGAFPMSPGLSDSTNAFGAGSPRTIKVYSKWEKQEFEARAMMKIREAGRKKEKEREAKEKEERERQERAERERQEKARLERESKERAERERQERERQEKDRQEKERKEKEAQQQKAAAAAAAAPASTPATSSPFAFSAPTGSVAAPSPFGAPSSETKPTAPAAASPFSFGPLTSGTTSTAPQPKTLPFGSAPPLGSTTGTEAKKEENVPAASGGASLLSRLGTQAPSAGTSSEPSKPATGASMFSFNTPKQESVVPPLNPFGAPASTLTAPAAGATTAPKFSFGFGTKSSTTTSTTPSTSNGGAKPSPSPFGAPSSTLSGALSTGASKAAPSASSAFSAFKTPGAPASATNGGSTTTSTPGTAPLKFNFGTSSTPSAFGGGSAFSGGGAAVSSEPTKSAFGGGSTPSAFAGAGPSGKSAFGNVGSSGQSAFGNNAGPSGQVAFGTNADSSGQSAFGNNTGSSGQSVFGGNATSSTAAPFGASAAQTQTPFGATTSNNANKPAEPQSSFGFSSQPSNPSSATTTTPATSNGSAPLKFAFGTASTPDAAPMSSTNAATSTPAAGASSSPFTFNFGSSTTPAAASMTPATSAFGAPAGSSTQSAFGSGVKSSVFGSAGFGSAANPQK